MLIVIDFQERLARHIVGIEKIVKNSIKLIKTFKILGFPILITEHVKLGDTLSEIKVFSDRIIKKSSFSCLRCDDFYREFKRINPRRVVLIGIEAHICVLQTALDLIGEGCEVYVALDCIGSRREFEREVAVMRMIQEGVKVCTSESVIYEFMETSEHEKFKDVLEIVKEYA